MKKQDFDEKVAQIWWVLYLIGGVGSKKIWALGPKKLAFLAIYSPVHNWTWFLLPLVLRVGKTSYGVTSSKMVLISKANWVKKSVEPYL